MGWNKKVMKTITETFNWEDEDMIIKGLAECLLEVRDDIDKDELLLELKNALKYKKRK